MHEYSMKDDFSYAIDYVFEKYDLSNAKQSILDAMKELYLYGYDLSLDDLFGEIE